MYQIHDRIVYRSGGVCTYIYILHIGVWIEREVTVSWSFIIYNLKFIKIVFLKIKILEKNNLQKDDLNEDSKKKI